MKTIFIFLLFAALTLTKVHPIYAKGTFNTKVHPSYATDTVAQPFLIKNQITVDDRVERLTAYLVMKRSPLIDYTHILIKTADKYEIPWNLIPAISGVESNFCKVFPKKSFNCWGWNNGNYYFNGYELAIETVGRTLQQKYFNYGLTTPESINKKYASSSSWAKNVSFFMMRIENFKIGSTNPIEVLSLTI